MTLRLVSSTDTSAEVIPQSAQQSADVTAVQMTQLKLAQDLRDTARNTASRFQRSYYDMGKVLYLIHSALDPLDHSKYLWESWGYESFYEYTEEELHIPEKTAQRMQRIFFRLQEDLKGLSQDLKDDLLDLGFSKVMILMEVITESTTEEWVRLASTLSCAQLRERVQESRMEILRAQQSLARKLTGEDTPFATYTPRPKKDKDTTEGRIRVSMPDRETGVMIDVAGPQDTEVTETIGGPPVESNERVFMKFSLYPDQLDAVESALKESQSLSGSVHPSQNLALICEDFNMTNRFGRAGDPKTVLHYLQKMERMLGVKLAAIDPNTKDVIYGLQTISDAVLHMEELAREQEENE